MICLFLNELIFTLLRVWGSEFGIPNRYTGFKVARNTALSKAANMRSQKELDAYPEVSRQIELVGQ